tara:strand:- start:1343 stop:1618 length:276 start_codon:yes stop_codon:yes gene_type:complete
VSLGKKDISKNISTKAHISLKTSEKILNSFLELLKDKGRNNILKISKFGTFVRKTSPERIGRNPKSKEEYLIKKRSKLIFKSSNIVKSILN